MFTIFVPPLRERKPDILLLADHFLEKFSREHGKQIKRISTPAIDMLMSYHWPGNVRELENVIERAVLVCDGQVIHAHHLPPTLQTAEASGTVDARSRCSDAVGGLREGPDSGRAQDGARQPRQGGAAARDDRAHPQLQGPQVHHRLPAVPRLAARGESPARHRDGRGARRSRREAGESSEYSTDEQRRAAGMHRPSNAVGLSPRGCLRLAASAPASRRRRPATARRTARRGACS